MMDAEPSKNVDDAACENEENQKNNEDDEKVVGDFLSKVTEKNLTTYILARCKQEVEANKTNQS